MQNKNIYYSVMISELQKSFITMSTYTTKTHYSSVKYIAWPLSAYITITAEIDASKVRLGIVYYSLSMGLVSDFRPVSCIM